ncbi:hypothetical protein PRK78_003797 [Emydomyces testavorans]|uniref:HIT-type domain-containing protein n=1 Tax=Emydomyces testavorans TaxID=2070801 RepID=A0AAF0DGP2_9EURO|nr:hypothetical protein PRK78_003797 [Emydomyces testavorans]
MTPLCQICNREPFKYRCPTCGLHSCSQAHKSNCAPKPSTLTPGNAAKNETPIARTDSQVNDRDEGSTLTETETLSSNSLNRSLGFAQLEKSQKVQKLFTEYSTLRSRLRDIYKSTLEEEWVEMRSPVQNRSQGRRRAGQSAKTKRNRGPWTAEKGFRRGLGRVRKWRESCEAGAGGADGKAFMEFIALVLGEDGTHADQHQLEGFI